MIRPARLLSAALLAACSPAMAQAPATPPSAPATPANQMDRIEQKLDEVLRRLDQPRNQPSGPLQAGSAVSAPPSPAPTVSGPPAASLEAYKPGGLVVARIAPRDPNSLSTIPADTVGGFVYTADQSPSLTSSRVGCATPGRSGWKSRAGCVRRKPGATSWPWMCLPILVRRTRGRLAFLQAWLENRSLDQRTALVSPSSRNTKDANATLVVGAELQPGLYRLRVWTVCIEPQVSPPLSSCF